MTRLSFAVRLVLLLVLTGLGWARPSDARASAEPAAASRPAESVLSVRRFSLVVGANDGGADRVILRYAVSDADAVGDVLRRFGGVEGGDHLSLSDPTPEQLQAVLTKISARIVAAKANGQHIQFVFYYSGHSDEEGLLLGGRRLSYKALRLEVQKVPADVRIAVLDSCASGAFTRTKGGIKREPFLVTTGTEVTGHAFLTSSSIDEAAQESDRIGGSFFTHYFTTGLRGAADVDGDRLITLSEAYQFAFDETLARTEATRGGAQHAAYDIQLAGSGDLVMTDLRKTSARLRIADAVGGRISIRSAAGELAAELYKPPGSGEVSLALEPGQYQVTVDDGRELWRTTLAVDSSGAVTLTRSMLHKVSPESTVERGDAQTPEVTAEHKLIGFNVGLLPPLSINSADRSGKPIRNLFSLAGVYSRVDRLDVFAGALGATIVDGYANGMQVALGFNKAQYLDGVQFGLGGNLATEASGAQLAIGFNRSQRLRGVQAGVINHVTVLDAGAQFGVVDIAGRLHGAQLGLLNIGREVNGAQIGLLNFSGSTKAAIGLLSVSREGGVHPEVSTSDSMPINIGLRLPTGYTYSLFDAGINPAGRGKGWQMGLGFGGHVPLPHKLFLDIDLVGYATFRGLSSVDAPDALLKLRLMVGWSPYKRLSVFGGPTFNGLFEADTTDVVARPSVYQFSALDYRNFNEQVRVRLWPGFVAGVRF